MPPSASGSPRGAPETEATLIDLRATRAMRIEDHRIAVKHREEAGARPMTQANRGSFSRALLWEHTCRERMERAIAAAVRGYDRAAEAERDAASEALPISAENRNLSRTWGCG